MLVVGLPALLGYFNCGLNPLWLPFGKFKVFNAHGQVQDLGCRSVCLTVYLNSLLTESQPVQFGIIGFLIIFVKHSASTISCLPDI